MVRLQRRTFSQVELVQKINKGTALFASNRAGGKLPNKRGKMKHKTCRRRVGSSQHQPDKVEYVFIEFSLLNLLIKGYETAARRTETND